MTPNFIKRFQSPYFVQLWLKVRNYLHKIFNRRLIQKTALVLTKTVFYYESPLSLNEIKTLKLMLKT